MQLIALLAIVPLLASAATHHPNADAARRALHRGLSHEHAAAEVRAEIIKRRDAAAIANPGSVAQVGRRNVKKRGAGGCRVRGSTFTASANSTSAAVTASSTAAASKTAAASSAAAATTTTQAGANFAASPESSSAAAATSSAVSSSGSGSGSSSSSGAQGNLTPNGKKAGVSAAEMVDLVGDHIGWWYDWDPTPSQYSGSSSATFASMLWGAGYTGGDQDSNRMNLFKALSWTPSYIMGTYEPDCSPPMSSGLDQATAAGIWNSLIAPKRSQGAVLVSPGMCKQADEDWLKPFQALIGDNMWDVTAVHINKLDSAGVYADLDHYAQYGKPLWITEFACVDDKNGFTPCTDQNQINDYINMIVPILESDSRVAAYAISSGEGLSYEWTSFRNGALTETGQTYLNAISKYH